MKAFLQRWGVTTAGVLVASQLVSGISYSTAAGLIVASLLLGIFNAVLRPILMLLTLPLMIFTFGLFTFVINAVLLMLVGHMVKGFHVDGFWAAFWGGLIISAVSMVANAMIGKSDAKTKSNDAPPPRRRGRPGSGRGPVIDV